MSQEKKRNVRRRARQIKRANRPKATLKEYLQYAVVILIILTILIASLYFSDTI